MSRNHKKVEIVFSELFLIEYFYISSLSLHTRDHTGINILQNAWSSYFVDLEFQVCTSLSRHLKFYFHYDITENSHITPLEERIRSLRLVKVS